MRPRGTEYTSWKGAFFYRIWDTLSILNLFYYKLSELKAMSMGFTGHLQNGWHNNYNKSTRSFFETAFALIALKKIPSYSWQEFLKLWVQMKVNKTKFERKLYEDHLWENKTMEALKKTFSLIWDFLLCYFFWAFFQFKLLYMWALSSLLFSAEACVRRLGRKKKTARGAR